MKIKQKKLGEKGGDNTKGWSSRVQRFEEEGRKGLDFKGHTHIFFGTGVKISRLPRRFFFFFFYRRAFDRRSTNPVRSYDVSRYRR